jgi:hypothetical protein
MYSPIDEKPEKRWWNFLLKRHGLNCQREKRIVIRRENRETLMGKGF